MERSEVEHIDSMTFAKFNLRLQAACERHQAHVDVAANGCRIIQISRTEGVRLSILSGLHGDERSGPIAALRWLEETAPGALIPPGVSLWMVPLLNDDGWDSNRREWKGVDLNRSFLGDVAPPFLREVMNALQRDPPFLYVDLHEDSDVSHAYLWRNVDDTHDLVERLQEYLSAANEPWSSEELWNGASESYIRRMGASLCTTLEVPSSWPLLERVEWHLKALQWCVGHILTYAGSFGTGGTRGAWQ